MTKKEAQNRSYKINMLLVKGLIVLNLGYITYQDLRSREVYWFLLPALIFLLGYLHFTNVLRLHFFNAIAINVSLVGLILGILYLYAWLIIKRPFFKEVFGFADGLYFLALAVAFPSVTFVIIFVFSLIFSLLVWLLMKHKSHHEGTPLAGYMAAFLLLIFIANWMSNTINLYLI
ncbi:hypothetical protein M0D21_13305 [Aquimarina sp. D1M17]|uniref:hypothetical protein n=1 Tax=Aquimarina acroporae TaxID=2937283 RepID=UPI0020BE0D95|nr:hypothetical protein [Aquimarina acroporae]MCK8522555.1 hypothetical protein [Aquimarina acroporae]